MSNRIEEISATSDTIFFTSISSRCFLIFFLPYHCSNDYHDITILIIFATYLSRKLIAKKAGNRVNKKQVRDSGKWGKSVCAWNSFQIHKTFTIFILYFHLTLLMLNGARVNEWKLWWKICWLYSDKFYEIENGVMQYDRNIKLFQYISV